MSKWAALVYGRTYEVDFRFIAVPVGFNSGDKDWAWQHIQPMLRSVESLSGKPRWCLFENSKYCIIGTTCMVSDLSVTGQDDTLLENSKLGDVTKDFKGRPLYVFVGYVADKRNGLSEIPQYSVNNLRIFQPLYQYVCDQWVIKSFQPESRIPLKIDYQEKCNFIATESFEVFEKENKSLNYSSDIFALWPDSEEYKSQLWHVLSENTIAQTDKVKLSSLCLALATRKDSVNSPFLNGTVVGVIEPEILTKVKQVPPVPPNKDPFREVRRTDSSLNREYSTRPNREYPNFSNNQDKADGWLEFIGALGGAALALKILRGPLGIVAVLVGGGLGWLTTGWINNKGMGGNLRKLIDSLIGLDINTSQQKREARNNTSRRDSFEERTTDGYGFKKKTIRSEDEGSEEWFS